MNAVGELDNLLAARGGDADAFARLISPYVPRLRRVARAILGPDLADDAVQEAVLAAWRALPGFRGDAAVGTWLHTIVYRASLRLARRGPAVEGLDALDRSAREWADEDWTVSPDEVAARAADHSELLDAIARLPMAYRSALVLHDVEGLTAADIAAVMDVPLGTAKARIRRARMAIVSELARRRAIDDAKEALR